MAALKRSSAQSGETRQQQRLARKERRHAERRQSILQAARRLLVTEGIENFTVNEVAALAQVSKPAVYYYFDSKEDLVGALAVETLRAEVDVLRQAIESAATGMEALTQLVRRYVEHYTADMDSFRVLYVWAQVLGVRQHVLKDEVYPLSASLNDALEEKLQRDKEQGRLAPDVHPRRLASVAWTMAHGLVSLGSGLTAVGGATRFSLSELCEEACRTLARSASG